MRKIQETVAGKSLIKPIQSKELIQLAFKASSAYKWTKNVKRTLNILNMYFRIMWDTVFEGYEWSIPDTMTIRIVKKVQTRPTRWFNNTVHKKDNQFMENKRSGFYYEIAMNCPHIQNKEMKLRAPQSARNRLKHVLDTTDKEYILIHEAS